MSKNVSIPVAIDVDHTEYRETKYQLVRGAGNACFVLFFPFSFKPIFRISKRVFKSSGLAVFKLAALTLPPRVYTRKTIESLLNEHAIVFTNRECTVREILRNYSVCERAVHENG